MRLPSRLAALRERNYRLLFTGQSLSYLGDQMTPVAISFAVLDHHGGTARQVGWVLGSGAAAMVLFLLIGGVIADRLPRRTVMLTADAVRAIAQGIAAGLLISGHWHVWQLVVLEIAWGIGAAFFQPAFTGFLPQLLMGENLVQANALQGLSWSVATIVGPALAGVLVATVGAGSAIAVDSATFVVSALMLSRLQLPAAAARVAMTNMFAEMREGWNAFRSRTWLWSIVLMFGLWHLLVLAPFFVLGAVVAKTHLSGATSWGTILSAFGVGSLIGGLVTLRLRPEHPLYVGMIGAAGFVPTIALLAAFAPLAAISAAAFTGGAGFALFGTYWDTTLQQQIPGELLSRVSAYDWFGSEALLPVGFVIVGPIAGVVGVRTTLIFSAVVLVIGIAAVIDVASVREIRADYTDENVADRESVRAH